MTGMTRVFQETDWTEVLMNEEWWDAIFGPLIQQLGGPILVGGSALFYCIALFWYTGSIFPPAVLLTMYAGLLVFGAPAPIAAAAGLVVTLAVALAYYSIARRYT